MGSRWSDEVAEELQDEESQEEDDKELLDEMEAQEVMKSQDEGVESQGETESQDETESQMEAESQEETESQDEMLSQMETPDNLHGNWADEVEDMINKRIDKELKLQKTCCGQSGRIRQICYRCQRAGHRARECEAERALDGEELPIPGNQRKQALPKGAGGHLVGGLNTGKHSTRIAGKLSSGKCYRCRRTGHLAMECYAKETLDGEELPIPTYPPGRGPTMESLLNVNRGRLSRSAGAMPRRPVGTRSMATDSYGHGRKENSGDGKRRRRWNRF